MRYRITTWDEGRMVGSRVCENEAVLGGVIAHTIGDCDSFTVTDADEPDAHTIMIYDKKGI